MLLPEYTMAVMLGCSAYSYISGRCTGRLKLILVALASWPLRLHNGSGRKTARAFLSGLRAMLP